MHTFWKEKTVKCMVICHGIIVTIIINIIIVKNLIILNIDVFSPAGNQHQVIICFIIIIIITLKNKNNKSNFILCR